MKLLVVGNKRNQPHHITLENKRAGQDAEGRVHGSAGGELSRREDRIDKIKSCRDIDGRFAVERGSQHVAYGRMETLTRSSLDGAAHP
jgi:hypothetical protein